MDRDEILNQVRIQTQISSSDVADADVVTIINQGYEEVAVAYDWPFLEASAAFSLSDSTQTYALSTVASDFNRAIALVDDDNDDTVEYVSPQRYFFLVGNDTGNESSTPDYWTIWEDKIYLSPIPSAADTNRLKLYYYKDPTTLSTGGSTPEWDAGFHYVLVEYAKWKLWERAEMFNAADRARQNYLIYISEMIQFYDKRTRRGPWIVGDGVERLRRHVNIADLRL